MLRIIFLAAFALTSVCADGDLIILHSPQSVAFEGKEPLNQSFLKEIFTVALGFTPKLSQDWSGIHITNPFDLPEAIVSIAVEGVESIDSPSGKRFPIKVDEGEETTWQAVSRRLEERDNNNTLVRICVGDGLNALGQSVLGELKPSLNDELSIKSLDLNTEEDKTFIEEIQLLHAIAKNVNSTTTGNGKSDVYWLVVSGLRPVFNHHGKDSPAAKEALSLLNDAFSVLSKAFMKVYNNKVVIAAFTNDANKTINTRSIRSIRVRRNATEGQLNLAAEYNETFPIMFNIILWFGLAMVFSLLAICIAIADMDPGRDSIIYRMTSNRMKKDN